MAKQLLYTDDARKKLLTGAEKLSKAVGITLGPTGRNVIIDKSFGGPTVTKDGVTVAKEIELPDPFENMGAKLVNAVAQKTSDMAGDGTTTATVLALAVYQEGLRNITAGANPMAVKRGIDKAVAKTVEHLEGTLTKKLSKKEEMEQVAAISANNDPKIGKLMADAFEKVGKDGLITVEEGKTSETTLQFVEGMQFDKGYISPYFARGNSDRNGEMYNALVPIYETQQAIEARVQMIRTQMEQTESSYDKEKFTERLAKLVGGVAIIRVGAATEAEMKQTKGRVEDALHATRAAVAEGIVPGGGVALLRCIPVVEELAEKLKGDERIGAEIVARALQKPIRTIAENCGKDGAVIADEVLTRGEKSPNIGYDANTDEYVDM